jgi:hypothetical protein
MMQALNKNGFDLMFTPSLFCALSQKIKFFPGYGLLSVSIYLKKTKVNLGTTSILAKRVYGSARFAHTPKSYHLLSV